MNWVGHSDCMDNSRGGARTVRWHCHCPSRGRDWQRRGWDDVAFYEEQETGCRLPLRYVVCRRRRTRSRAFSSQQPCRPLKTRPKKVQTRAYITNNIFMPLSTYSGPPRDTGSVSECPNPPSSSYLGELGSFL